MPHAPNQCKVLIMEQLSKQKFKRGVQWLSWSGVLATVGAGSILAYSLVFNQPTTPISVRVATVERGTIEESVNESGTLELGNQQILKSPAEATVEQVLVQLGTGVKAGRELIVLRDPERETILAKKQLEISGGELTLASRRQEVLAAEGKLRAARQELQKFLTFGNAVQLDIREQELKLANDRQKVVEAEEDLAAAQQKLQESKDLFDKGFIAGNEVRNQEEEIRRAKSALREAQLTVNTTTLQLQRLQLQLQLSERELRDEIAAQQSELATAQLQLGNDTRELQRLQLEYREIEQRLQNSIVTATIDGKVLDIKVKNGAVVQVGDPLLTLGDPDREFVKLNLSTLNAAKVQPNQLARISVIGPDERTYTGRVENLSLQATTGDGSNPGSGSSDQATVSATVKLDKPTGTLIPSSQVNVEIVLKQQENVVVLPTEAIQQSGSKPFVWLRDDRGLARRRDVTLGLEGLTTVEVTSGINAGEEVVLPLPGLQLTPGTPLNPQF